MTIYCDKEAKFSVDFTWYNPNNGKTVITNTEFKFKVI